MELYINNQLADLGDDVNVKINKQTSDVTNPTLVKTDTSKTITIPRTINNNNIFNQYFRLDKILNVNDYSANQRVPYTLMDGSVLIMKGYLKLIKITNDNYEIVLFDLIADLLRNMEGKMVVDSMPALGHNINRNFVINSWNFNPTSTNDTGSIYDYVSYCPAYKGTYEDFNNSKIEMPIAGGFTHSDIGYDKDEYDINEFRSYYQQPCIYYNKLIKNICDDNNIRLHHNFHSDVNPYWKNTVVMFPKLINSNSQNSYFSTEPYGKIQYIIKSDGTQDPNSYNGSQKFATISDPYNVNNLTELDLSNYPAGEVIINYQFKIKLKLLGPTAWANKLLIPVAKGFESYVNNRIRIATYFTGQTNMINNQVYTVGNYYSDIKINTDSAGDGYFKFDGQETFTLTGQAVVPSSITDAKLRMELHMIVDNNEGVIVPMAMREWGQSSNLTGSFFVVQSEVVEQQYSYANIVNKEKIRSNAYINKSNIIPSDLKQSDLILNHIKTFGLVIDRDDDGYIIKDRNTYYSEGEILDFTNKIDINKDITITPISYDKRFQNLKYKANETTHYKNYSTLSDIKFSDYRIDTNFEFNIEQDDIYNSMYNAPLISQEYTLNRDNNLWERMPYPAPAMHTINGEKKAKAEAKITLLFKYPRFALPYWKNENETIKSHIFVSDDSPNMTNTNEFCWQSKTASTCSEYQTGLDTAIFPYFNSVSPDFKYSLEFGKNRMYYNTYIDDSLYKEDATLYNKFYKKWVTDRYDVNVKILSCYVKLTKSEMSKLKLNNFIIIDDSLFIIHKIIDFDLINENLTRVEFIRVMDMDNYTNGQDLISPSYKATTLSLTDNDIIQISDGDEDITFNVSNNNLIATTPDNYTGTITIVDGYVIKND